MPQPSWRCNTHTSKARLYADKNIPPLTQLLEQLQTEMQTGVALKATVDGGLVGSMRAHMAMAWPPIGQRAGQGRRLCLAAQD